MQGTVDVQPFQHWTEGRERRMELGQVVVKFRESTGRRYGDDRESPPPPGLEFSRRDSWAVRFLISVFSTMCTC